MSAAAGAQGQTAAAAAISQAACGVGRSGPVVSIGGDSYNLLVSDAGTAGLAAALIADRKRQRLNEFMGM